MRIEKRKPEDMPQCPYCRSSTPMFTELGGGLKTPGEGDVSICLHCSGIALFTGQGLNTRRPTFEEKHALLADPGVRGGISMANHWRNHHI